MYLLFVYAFNDELVPLLSKILHFSGYAKIYKIFTGYLEEVLPNFMNVILEYLTSPGVVIPLFLLLILIIYYLTSLTGSLREANNDLRLQLRREKNEDKPEDGTGEAPVEAANAESSTKWTSAKKVLPVLPNKFRKGHEDDIDENGEKKNGRTKHVQYTDDEDAQIRKRVTKKSQSKTDSFKKRASDSLESRTSVNSDVPVITISQPYSDDPVVDDEGEETTSDLDKPTEESEDLLEEEEEEEKEETQTQEEDMGEEDEATSETRDTNDGQTTSESQEDTVDESSTDKVSTHSRPPLISQTPISFRSHTEHSRSVSPIHESLEELEGYSDEPMSGSYPTSQETSQSVLQHKSDNRRKMREQQSSSRESSNSPARFPPRKHFTRAASEKVISAEDAEIKQAKLQRLATDSL